ncbi:hypothetical protein DFH06DRAFT_1482350 [Mycena polygramma]|nr:hypothetical protein DFH06DRAFT_1482350 [Mycena polygramma]
MSSIANLPILTLVSGPSLAASAERPTEREIDRNALVAISPDREGLFLSNKSIDELRQFLKLRTGPLEKSWLFQAKRRANVDFRDATARTSTLIHRVQSPIKITDENSPADASKAVRRVFSTASLDRISMPLRIQNGVPGGGDGSGPDIWGSFFVSTMKKLVSPRPLAPTHILVAHTEPLAVSKSGKSSLPRRPHDDGSKPSFPNMDIPINDLLFQLGVPNLTAASGLPPRLHQQLSRVLLLVPHLETFHEIIVFLHTYNQAEMFRKLIPEWIRDLMHPLPVVAPKDTASIFSPKKPRGPASLFSRLAPSKIAGSGASVYSVDTVSSGMSGHSYEPLERTPDIIARDIVDSLPFFSDEDPGRDELVATIATLNALKANLEFLGYFGKAVWDELEMSLNILTRALVHRAAVTEA